MTRLNTIQSAILSLDGGEYHNLLDEYLYKKFNLDNIHSLGVQTATNKSTKGIPDSYIENEEGTYTLIMYGTVRDNPYKKLKEDIESSLESYKEEIEQGEIKEIIAAYTSTNIDPYQLEELKALNGNVDIKLIGLSTLSQDLLLRYPRIALDHLNIPIDSEQIFSIKDFIKRYDSNQVNAPLSVPFGLREEEQEKIYETIKENKFTLVTGQSGVGKTKLVIEVCKQYEKNHYKVFCIKNNDLRIHEDLRYYLGDSGKYILFIDDINEASNLDYILSFVVNPPENVSIKVVATVRDYAKQYVGSKLREYYHFSEIFIDSFETDEIKAILENSLEINNDFYLNRISKISKGNIRLAILAGLDAEENGYPAINNAIDIFRNYYGEIIESQKLNEQEMKVLFIISLLKSIRFKENEFASKLLEEFKISGEEFIAICHKLNENELIDLYYDEVVRISDQSFRDYILHYTLISKKIISVSRVLNIGFPRYKEKIIFALNTVTDLFPSEANINYIKEQVNLSWEQADLEMQQEYLKSFYQLNETKALKMIKDSIDEMEPRDINLFEVDELITNKSGRNGLIGILGHFKYSEYFNEAIELLVYFFEKRLDLFSDFYNVLTTSYFYDERSAFLDYEKEYELFKSLWEYSELGENQSVSLLIVYITREFLKYNFEIVRSGETGKEMQFIHGSIIYSKGSKDLRTFIWEILSLLYNQEPYKSQIHDIIMGYTRGLFEDNQSIELFKYDMECIKNNFVLNWSQPTFEQSKVLYTLKEKAENLAIDYDESFDLYQNNKDFKIYNVLSKDYYHSDLDSREIEEKKKLDLEDLVKQYTLDDFQYLFNLCQKFEESDYKKAWSTSQSISIIFTLIEDWDNYVDIVEVYLENNSPYYSQVYSRIITSLIKLIGTAATKDLLTKFNYTSQKYWGSRFWELLPEEEIVESDVENLLKFVSSQSSDETVAIPNIFYLKKYTRYDSKIIQKVSRSILEINPHTNAVIQFLHNPRQMNDINILLSYYSDDMELLEELYLTNDESMFDYEGTLFIKLVENSIEFFDRYTQKINKSDKHPDSFSEKFNLIWSLNNSTELIEIALDNLITEKYSYINNIWSEVIFSTSNNRNKKEQWIKNYIEQNKDDMEKVRNIFYLVHDISGYNTLEFFIEFLKHDQNIDNFKLLPLYSLSYSFFGSEVGVYDKRISFIESLIDNLEGIEYLAHIAYLEEQAMHQKRTRQEIEIREHVEEII